MADGSIVFDALAAEHNIAPNLVSFAQIDAERPGAWFGHSKAHTEYFNDGERYYGQALWRGAKLAYITDGRSNTILIGEQAGTPQRYNGPRPFRAIPNYEDGHTWFFGATSESGQQMQTEINRMNIYAVFAFHPAGAHVVFCDGSTRFLSEDISQITMRHLLARDDGQPIDWTDL